MEQWAPYAVLVKRGGAILLLQPRDDRTPELVHQRLHPVTNAQDRQSLLEDPIGNRGGSRIVNAGGTTGEDNALGLNVAHRLPGA